MEFGCIQQYVHSIRKPRDRPPLGEEQKSKNIKFASTCSKDSAPVARVFNQELKKIAQIPRRMHTS